MGTAIDDVAWGVDEILSTLFTNPNEDGTKQAGFTIVKKIQRGEHNFTSTSNATISINNVNPDKCLVLLNSSLAANAVGIAGNMGNTVTYRNQTYSSRLVSLSATKLVISSNYYRENYSSFDGNDVEYGYGIVGWQIIEFY